MRERQKRGRRKPVVLLSGLLAAVMLSSCGAKEEGLNLAASREENEKVVNMFSPMEKTDPGVENTARSASDKTVIMAEETLGLTMAYRTYTAEDYQEKTYDDVTLSGREMIWMISIF